MKVKGYAPLNRARRGTWLNAAARGGASQWPAGRAGQQWVGSQHKLALWAASKNGGPTCVANLGLKAGPGYIA